MVQKVGIIPDLHGNDKWKAAIEQNPQVNQWIFLGDYVDSFIYDNVAIHNNLQEIIAFKIKYPTTSTLLLGNHDIQYMFKDPWYMCSGYRETAFLELNDLFTTYKDLFDLGTKINDIYVTHAGITESWFRRFTTVLNSYKVEVDRENVITWMNDTLHKGPKKVFDVIMHLGRARGGFEANGGPLWCDERELKLDALDKVTQIVGHTPQKGGKITQYETATNAKLFFTDTGELETLQPFIFEYEK